MISLHLKRSIEESTNIHITSYKYLSYFIIVLLTYHCQCCEGVMNTINKTRYTIEIKLGIITLSSPSRSQSQSIGLVSHSHHMPSQWLNPES